jgi:TPR repeat protein
MNIMKPFHRPPSSIASKLVSRYFLCLLLTLLLVVGTFSLSPQNKAHAKTLFLTTLEAERGNTGAQYDLGLRYFYGRGTERDTEKGLDWLNRAAENGSTLALNRLGFLYLNGVGVRQNNDKAFSYFKESAHAGSTVGQFNFGYVNQFGIGVEPDPAIAFQWYLIAAKKDHVSAQYNVGLMLLRGQGVIRDHVAAIQWLKKAGNLGSGEALHAIGTLFFGDFPSIPRHLDSARLYFLKAVEQDYRPSGLNLGIMMARGLGGKTEPTKAYALLKWSNQDHSLVNREIEKLENSFNSTQFESSDIVYLALKNKRYGILLQ